MGVSFLEGTHVFSLLVLKGNQKEHDHVGGPLKKTHPFSKHLRLDNCCFWIFESTRV